MPYTMHDRTKHAWQQVLWQWSILLILSCQRPSDTEFVHTSSRTEGGIPSDMWWILPASLGSVLLHLTIHSLIPSISSLKTLLANLNISEAPLPTYQTTESSERFCSRKQTTNIHVHQSINPPHMRVEPGKVQHLRCNFNATHPSNSPCFQATLGQRSWGLHSNTLSRRSCTHQSKSPSLIGPSKHHIKPLWKVCCSLRPRLPVGTSTCSICAAMSLDLNPILAE